MTLWHIIYAKICTVEKEGFRSIIKTLDRQYELPSRVHFSVSVTPDLYASTKKKVAKQLAGVKFFAATSHNRHVV